MRVARSAGHIFAPPSCRWPPAKRERLPSRGGGRVRGLRSLRPNSTGRRCLHGHMSTYVRVCVCGQPSATCKAAQKLCVHVRVVVWRLALWVSVSQICRSGGSGSGAAVGIARCRCADPSSMTRVADVPEEHGHALYHRPQQPAFLRSFRDQVRRLDITPGVSRHLRYRARHALGILAMHTSSWQRGPAFYDLMLQRRAPASCQAQQARPHDDPCHSQADASGGRS